MLHDRAGSYKLPRDHWKNGPYHHMHAEAIQKLGSVQCVPLLADECRGRSLACCWPFRRLAEIYVDKMTYFLVLHTRNDAEFGLLFPHKKDILTGGQAQSANTPAVDVTVVLHRIIKR